MSRIRSRNTRPERIVRSILHSLGLRFRLHTKLPGRPDIVLARHRTVVIVHGCFWHRHARCKYAYTPRSSRTFWLKKFADNTARDRRVRQQLLRLRWRIVTVWECETRDLEHLRARMRMEFFRDEG